MCIYIRVLNDMREFTEILEQMKEKSKAVV